MIVYEEPVREKADTIARILIETKNAFELYIHRDKIEYKDIVAALDLLIEKSNSLEKILGCNGDLSNPFKTIQVIVLNIESESVHPDSDMRSLLKKSADKKFSDTYKKLFYLNRQIQNVPEALKLSAAKNYQVIKKIYTNVNFSFDQLMDLPFSLNDVVVPLERVVDECLLLEKMLGHAEESAIINLARLVKQLRIYIMNYVSQEHVLDDTSDTLMRMKMAAVKIQGQVQKSLIEVQEKVHNRIKADHHKTLNLMNNIRFMMMAGVLIGILFAIVGAVIMSRALMTPIAQLVAATHRLAKGDLSYRIETISGDEIGQLGKALNQMAENLQNITVSRDTLSETQHFIRNIFDTMTESIVVTNEMGDIHEINRSTMRLSGYAAIELLDHPMSMLFDENDIFMTRSWIDHLVSQGGEYNSERVLHSKSGERIPVLFSAAIMYKKKQIQGIVCVSLDIRQRKKAEEKLRQAYDQLKKTQAQLVQTAKLSSIGELAAGVAHELNQPLMVIRTGVQMIIQSIKKDRFDSDMLIDNMDIFDRNTKRMMNIINHLRTFSRQSHTEFCGVDIHQVIEDACLMISEQLRLKNITLKKVFDSNLPQVKGDANQLEQVFLNLITNARDAIMDKNTAGQIEIKTECSNSEKMVIIFIQDTGGGISSEYVNRIFDPFYTTKDVGKGTGLGLSISYGIIQDHHGDIFVSKTGKEGTTFAICLPANTSEKTIEVSSCKKDR
ncbi:MAG: PAS domain S-box protein [Candidatus Magnetomorum sp.]|nr:PAS domain S-box protein [Candidatus Magnetomorum sp.]